MKTKKGLQEPTPILNTPNGTSDANASHPAPDKVHLRGLDNLTTKDIRAFAAEYYDTYKPVHIEWIDDTSANIIYESADIARDALIAFAAIEISDVTQIPPLQTIAAKSFPLHPETNLEVRLAVLGDRKQAGARERSRFYLFNPEYDPAERRKRASNRGGNRYRDRDDGGYRSQRYDDREQHKRERESEFDASLYDDDEVAIAKRAARSHHRQDSSSGSDSRGRDSRRSRYQGVSGKELFPERRDRAGGRLRNRSASPLRDADEDRNMEDFRVKERKRQEIAVAANRQKAQLIKARLREASATKELFPQKTAAVHRRSGAFDAADETADLFASRMAVPFMDGGADERLQSGGSLASRITSRNADIEPSGFNIRGAAKSSINEPQSFSIKGAALTPRVKELFPSTFGDNAGKELFSDRLEGRGGRRQKAEDLFS
jgi:hypothetical protein